MQIHSGSFRGTTVIGIAAIAIGALAWSGHFFTLLGLLALPIVFKCANGTPQRIATLACYYAGSIWPIMPGATQFFGNDALLHPLSIVTLWLTSTAILTLPWIWFFAAPRCKAEWALPIGLSITALPPTGIVNPLTVAGVLFPGLGWVGLVATVILFGTLTRFRLYSVALTVMLAVICYVSHPGIPAVPSMWEGHNTQLGGAELNQESPSSLYRAVLYVQNAAAESNTPVQVFPESIITHWTPIAESFWEPTFSELKENHQTILFGAEEAGPHRRQYRNEVLVRGEYTATFQQRIPIPYAMWRPWDKTGVPIHYFGPATLVIGDRRAAPIICYEQLLVAPLLLSIRENPDVLLGIANDYWAAGTSIPEIQNAAITAWSRLFWIPLVTATNK